MRWTNLSFDAMLILALTYRATEMDITMIGLQNAGKTSLLRVLAVRRLQTTILKFGLEADDSQSTGRRIHY
jgi:ABC-type phosphate/phosphonate transport system ATPase subunit